VTLPWRSWGKIEKIKINMSIRFSDSPLTVACLHSYSTSVVSVVAFHVVLSLVVAFPFRSWKIGEKNKIKYIHSLLYFLFNSHIFHFIVLDLPVAGVDALSTPSDALC